MKLSEFEALKPLEFTRSIACHFDWIQGTHWLAPEWIESDLVITMVFRHQDDSECYLFIRFLGVANIKISSRQGINYSGGLGALCIHDITDRQWYWNFEVFESEDEGFQFLCQDFDAYIESRDNFLHSHHPVIN